MKMNRHQISNGQIVRVFVSYERDRIDLTRRFETSHDKNVGLILGIGQRLCAAYSSMLE